MELLRIKEEMSDNAEFAQNPGCLESLAMSVEFYKKVGYEAPWVGYYAKIGNDLVGAAGFKGRPVDNRVEIAYGTFPQFRSKGIGAEMCRQLVTLSLKTDPGVRVCARTLPEENHSTAILRKNGFILLGSVIDLEDGEVWEWEWKRRTPKM